MYFVGLTRRYRVTVLTSSNDDFQLNSLGRALAGQEFDDLELPAELANSGEIRVSLKVRDTAGNTMIVKVKP